MNQSPYNYSSKIPNDIIFQKLRTIIIDQLAVDESEVVPEADLLNDLGCDELDVVELLIAIGTNFNMGFSKSEEKNIRTVGDIYRFLKKVEKYLSLDCPQNSKTAKRIKIICLFQIKMLLLQIQ